MNILPIGYPLGFLSLGEYTVERFETRNAVLSIDEFTLWADAFQKEDTLSDFSKYKSLIEKGAALPYESKEELLTLVSPLNPIRSGDGWLVKDKICVIKNGTVHFVTKSQYELWVKSNGGLNVGEILNGNTGLNTDSICDELIYLVINELLHLR